MIRLIALVLVLLASACAPERYHVTDWTHFDLHDDAFVEGAFLAVNQTQGHIPHKITADYWAEDTLPKDALGKGPETIWHIKWERTGFTASNGWKLCVDKVAFTDEADHTIYLGKDCIDSTNEELVASILVHEMGHVFGMEHSDDRNSPMYDGPKSKCRTIYTETDWEGVAIFY